MKNKDVKNIEVHLWEQLVGRLAVDSSGVGYFKYAPDFVETGLQPSPLMMPVNPNTTYSFKKLNPDAFKGMPGMISDSLPDAYGDQLLDIYFDKLGLSQQENIQLLKLCYISHKATGALEYKPPFTSTKQNDHELNLSLIMETVDKLLTANKDLKAGDLNNIQDIISIGSSLGGAAPKAVIGIDFDTNSIKPGNIPLPENYDYWIVKFDALKNDSTIHLSETRGYGNVEYVYYRMVLEAGIPMSECRLLHEDGRTHFLTKRFDRVGGEKIHMQSLNALAHADSYGTWDYDLYFRVLTKLKAPYHTHEEMYKRIVFNGLSGNTDTHTKNTSFLMGKDGKWRLSPYYDVICGVSLRAGNTLNHKTLINGKRRDFTRSDFLEVAKRNGIKQAERLIEQVREALSKWESLAKEFGVKPEYQAHVSQLIEANNRALGA